MSPLFGEEDRVSRWIDTSMFQKNRQTTSFRSHGLESREDISVHGSHSRRNPASRGGIAETSSSTSANSRHQNDHFVPDWDGIAPEVGYRMVGKMNVNYDSFGTINLGDEKT